MSTVFASKAFNAVPSRSNANYSTTRLRTMDDEEEDEAWSEVLGSTVSPNCWPAFSTIKSDPITLDDQYGLNICSTDFLGKFVVAWVAPGSPSVIQLTTSADGTTWTPNVEPYPNADVKQVSITVATLNNVNYKLWMGFLNQNNNIVVGYSPDGNSWTRKFLGLSGTSISICGFQASVYLAYTRVTDNQVMIASSSNGFVIIPVPTATPYFGSSVSLASFQGSLYLAFVDMNGRVNVAKSDGTNWSNWYTLRNASTTTPGQQWSAANGCLSLSSDANRLYLAFSQLNQTVYVASTTDPSLSNWSNASPVPNTSSTLSVSITSLSFFSSNLCLLQIDSSNSNLIQIAPYYLLSLSVGQVEGIVATAFPKALRRQVTDDNYIPLNEIVLQYLYTNYRNTKLLLGSMKCFPNTFGTDSLAITMKSIVSKYSYGDYPDMDSPEYVSYDTGTSSQGDYDFRWTSLGGLCGLIYAQNTTLPEGQQLRCFNFTVDVNFAMICFDPITGTKVVPSNGTINGFTPTEIIY